MNPLRFIVAGKPMGKQRPRVTRTHTYTPKKTVDYEKHVKAQFRLAYPKHKLLETPARMVILACMAIPKATSKKNRSKMASGELRPTKKPDIDNIIKIVADALNQVAYLDDKQIVSSACEKIYSNRARVEVEISEVSHETL